MDYREILIGSAATKIHYPEAREPKDYDYIVNKKVPSRGETCWGDKAEYFYLPELEWIFNRVNGDIAPPDILYTIKFSHIFWNINWEKHVSDISFFQLRGLRIVEELYSILYPAFERLHGKKKAYLKRTNEEFFKDSVKRQYVHDDIHLAIAYGERPLYESIKKDLGNATVSEELFLGLNTIQQLNLCREEIYVTALERFLIPRQFNFSKIAAYRGAIKLLVTSMSKGWFPRFIMENWNNLKEPDCDFVMKFRNALANGKVKCLKN